MIQVDKASLHQVVPFSPGADKLLLMDFTAANAALTENLVSNPVLLNSSIEVWLRQANARYGIGGYAEDRALYRTRALFGNADNNTAGESRSIHLGIDIWGPEGTPVYAPLAGVVHSFAFNNQPGDYGATIIVQHTVNGNTFHTLYGHLSFDSIRELAKGQEIAAGALLARFGNLAENGNWPPHLHFQVVIDMQGKEGDYPGVCKPSEKDEYLANCPDADKLLQMMRYATAL
ncbi:Peptidase family M23 [Filimonas lacunae]|uniref:Peptidase family M23 n=1 Tax=Filimonas lacunae TaxID=477680 RepID=A0A173MNB4_9BACT|nr:peptidoglycan DD-metalloendopeptidase family protein [Filimonas lacunae]BAV09133.1 M23/M37 peptidase/aminotransferase, class III [Filimonas lacunae]SIS67748.1 Peptidase family M23 [Filimonas lacunae]